jgi:hypothetical protein
MNMFEMEKKSFLTLLPLFANMMVGMCEETLNHTNVQKLIHSDEKFDVVIVEQFMNEAQKALATRFNAPLILFSTMGANSWVNQLIGNPQPLAYIPEALLGYSSKMTFSQRLVNIFTYVAQLGLNHFYIYPEHDKLIKKYFPNGPSIYDVIYNASIVLLNSHPSINQPVPYVPSMIDVGGLHVKTPKKLPTDLQQLLDNAKEGVIYFSLGSNLKSALLPNEKRQILLNTFSKLKETVLWKWEDDTLPGKPANVHIAKWLPQQDVLGNNEITTNVSMNKKCISAHPNLKLFITHGGLLSTTETIYHGVPALAIPIAGDQKLNARQIVNMGIGLTIGYQEITEEALSNKINQLLTNPK